jgi:hypothetical protein
MSDDGEQMALPMYRCAETPEEEDWSIDDLIEGDKEMFDQLEESMDLQTWQNFKKAHRDICPFLVPKSTFFCLYKKNRESELDNN